MVGVSVPGFRLESTTFVPESSAAAPQPKYLGEQCRGFRVVVTDRAVVQPYRLGVELILELRKQPDFEWRRQGEALTWLMGTPRLYEDFEAGMDADEIVAFDEPDHETWRQERREFLLY